MAEGNGEYTNYSEPDNDFKRKLQSSEIDAETAISEEGMESGGMTEKANNYIRELLSEREMIRQHNLDPPPSIKIHINDHDHMLIDRKYVHSDRLLEQEIDKVKLSGKPSLRDNKYVDIYREKPIRVICKVLVPVREHPKFNFVGKLLGPKGNSMKRLQEDTMCKMAVLGRGSMKDRKKEEELRASLDPKYAHLNDELHVEISALGPPAEAHARIAFALAEVRKYLIPDSNDVIRQEQLREMLTEPEEDGSEAHGAPPHKKRSVVPHHYASPYRPQPPPSRPPSSRTVMPAKTKILSILDRARVAMEESHTHGRGARSHHHPRTAHYEDPTAVAHYEPTHYDYAYAPPPSTSRSRYEAPVEYEAEYRRDYYRETTNYPVKSSHSHSSWKEGGSSAYAKHPNHEERSSSSSKQSRSHSSRESRYHRSSPYTRK